MKFEHVSTEFKDANDLLAEWSSPRKTSATCCCCAEVVADILDIDTSKFVVIRMDPSNIRRKGEKFSDKRREKFSSVSTEDINFLTKCKKHHRVVVSIPRELYEE